MRSITSTVMIHVRRGLLSIRFPRSSLHPSPSDGLVGYPLVIRWLSVGYPLAARCWTTLIRLFSRAAVQGEGVGGGGMACWFERIVAAS